MATGSLNIGTANIYSTTYSTTGYYIDGTQVIGARGTAIANMVNTDGANLADAVNNILVMVRTHGLIAP